MVIQRWQSVMLLIAAVMMGFFSFISLGQIQSADYTFNITALGICREGIATAAGEPTCQSTIVSFIISLLATLLPFISIFLFRNLRLQKRMTLISALFTAVVCVIIPMVAYNLAGAYEGTIGWGSAICMPIIAIIAELTAWRLINGDQKKLRAADRLR